MTKKKYVKAAKMFTLTRDYKQLIDAYYLA